MTQPGTLQSLERLLESFLGNVVKLKEHRLAVLEGIDSLDNITRKSSEGTDIVDPMGEWFARHNRWLTDKSLKDADIVKISDMLDSIKSTLTSNRLPSTPATRKISTEIDRWHESVPKGSRKIILKRPAETTPVKTDKPTENIDTISLFVKKLSKISALFMDYAGNKQHILTVLDDALKAASSQVNKDALILSAFIIYYLKQNGYKVEPYVKKLKEAETFFKQRTLHA